MKTLKTKSGALKKQGIELAKPTEQKSFDFIRRRVQCVPCS